MDATLFPRRLAPLYGLVLTLLPVAIIFQEFWSRLPWLPIAAFLFMLGTLVYYTLREYWMERGTRGHEGGHGLQRSAQLVVLALFMLLVCGVWRLLQSFATGHQGLHLPRLLPLDPDATWYILGLLLFLALYWLAHQFPGVRFDFNLRWRWRWWDILLVVLLGLITWAGLALYVKHFGSTHQPMSVFGVERGSLPPLPYALVGIVFALANTLTEELWFRGVLLGALRPLLPPVRLLVLQGLAFGLFHWFGTPHGVLGVLLAGIWGGLLGWWVYRRGSLWPAVVVHFVGDWLIFLYTN